MGERKFDYTAFLSNVGIENGDVLDVASDLVSIMLYCSAKKLEFDPNLLIDAIVDSVGEEGTVLIRAFNWDFCKGIPFDIKRTPSKVGALGNVALKRNDFKRTQHPLYSWMVKGRLQKQFCSLTNTESFGKNTPFDLLHKNSGKVLMVGNADITGLTQYHDAEKLAEVPYRKEKKFRGDYVDVDGTTTNREYSMFVRPLNVSVTYELVESPKFEQMCIANGWVRRKMYHDSLRCETYKIIAVMDYFVNDLRTNKGENVVTINGTAGFGHDSWNPATAHY